MFEECFSMIELNTLSENNLPAAAMESHDPAFFELSKLLVEALDRALNHTEEPVLSLH